MLFRKNQYLYFVKRIQRAMSPEDIALQMTPGIGVKSAVHLLECFGSAARIFAATEEELTAMRFNWRVVKQVHSNAIVFGGTDRTLGIGAGQMSRVDSARIAVWKAGQAGLDLKGSVVASDAMFPFADGLQVAIDAGATACIQPGGSIRDEEVIAAADAAGIAMVFTGHRHFLH